MNYLDSVKEKRLAAQDDQKHSTSRADAKGTLDSLINQLKEVQLAALLGGQQKPQVILADSTDLGERMSEISKQIGELLKTNSDLLSTAKKPKSTDELSALKALKSSVDSFISTSKTDSKSGTDTLTKALASLEKAIKGIDVSPVVNIPETKLTVPKVDLKPLQKTLESHFAQPMPESGTKLDDFKAHDIRDSGKDTQYIGFLHPSSAWYIIENRVKDNSLRYVFGKGDYAKAFQSAGQYQYQLLDEAINALQT